MKHYKRKQGGYTLLEYCAGAAILAGIVWLALGRFGGSVSNLIDGLVGWMDARTTEIEEGTQTPP
ncbi:MAG: hypothetical protein QY326_02500 [Bdellovibrionota bacterium]|nr:MAG: hypothetical protein QY326_02500 [Bdellovibrionota bacterium]